MQACKQAAHQILDSTKKFFALDVMETSLGESRRQGEKVLDLTFGLAVFNREFDLSVIAHLVNDA